MHICLLNGILQETVDDDRGDPDRSRLPSPIDDRGDDALPQLPSPIDAVRGIIENAGPSRFVRPDQRRHRCHDDR